MMQAFYCTSLNCTQVDRATVKS